MDIEGVFSLICFFGAMALPWLGLYGISRLIRRRGKTRITKELNELEQLPVLTDRASFAGPGRYRIEGKVKAEPVFLSPSRSEDCCYYSFGAFEWDSKRNTQGQMEERKGKQLAQERTETELQLVCADIELTVSLSQARNWSKPSLGLSRRRYASSSRFKRDGDELLFEALENHYKVSTSAMLGSRSLRISEEVLCDGDPMVIIGTIELDSDTLKLGSDYLVAKDFKHLCLLQNPMAHLM